MNKIDYPALIGNLFASQLRADVNRYYLGTLWWFLEPVLYVVVFYFVFLNFRNRDEEFLFSLICGLCTWKWISSVISHGSSAIVQSKGLVKNFSVNPIIFPINIFLINTFKFFIIGIAVVCLLVNKGALAFGGALSLMVWFFSTSLVIFSYQLMLCLLMPYLPDLRMVIGNAMMLLLFTSGVIIPVESMPLGAQEILVWNPFVYLVEGVRDLMIEGVEIDYSVFVALGCGHLVLISVGYIALHRVKGEIPKRLI